MPKDYPALLETAVRHSIQAANTFDRKRIVQGIEDAAARAHILANLSHENKPETEVGDVNLAIIDRLVVYGKGENPHSSKIYIAGALGCNDLMFDELRKKSPSFSEARKVISKRTYAHSIVRYSFPQIFAGFREYDAERHGLTFPHIRAQGSGIDQALQWLAEQLGSDVIVPQTLDAPPKSNYNAEMEKSLREQGEKNQLVVVAYGLSPDEAWQKYSLSSDHRFKESQVRTSAEHFGKNFSAILAAVPDVILYDKNNEVIVQKSQGKFLCFDSEKLAEYYRNCGVRLLAAPGFGTGIEIK